MMQAQRNTNTITLESLSHFDGQIIAEVRCEDFKAYKKLPASITHQDTLLALTGWDSDNRLAYYKNTQWALNRIGTVN